MNGPHLTLLAPPPQRLDLSALLPQSLAGQTASAIERLPIGTTRAKLLVGDIFRVKPGSDAALVLEGGSERFDYVGKDMSGGTLLLDGDAGICAGRGMTGGLLTLRGNAGHWAASALRGGRVEIDGGAGDHLGGARAGERTGMAGGVVIVRGTAGARAGDRMRRGLLIIEGAAGAYAASGMVAGTLVICGIAGTLPGYLMRRGTLLLGGQPVTWLPTFVPVGHDNDGVFTRLLARALLPISALGARLAEGALRRFAGDMASLGKGEILLGNG